MQATPKKYLSQFTSRFIDFLPGILAWLIFAVPLGIFFFTGAYNRLMVDDYMTMNVLHQYGFWGAQKYWYIEWSGRFSFTFLMTLVELGGTLVFPWIPGLMLAFWLGAVTWALREAFTLLETRYALPLAAFSASVIVCLTLWVVPNIYQVAFWVTGVLTYMIPLSFIALIAAVILREYRLRRNQPVRRSTLIWIFLLALVGGGFSETSLAMQTGISGLAAVFVLALVPRQKRGPLFPLIAASVVGSLVSLAIVGLAPGNAVRAGATSQKGVGWAITATWQSVSFYLINAILVRKRFQFLISLLVVLSFSFLFLDIPALRKLHFSIKNVLLLGILPAGSLLLLAYMCYFPAYLIISNGPPERATVIAISLEAFLWVAWGLLGGQAIRQVLQGQMRSPGAVLLSRLAISAGLVGILVLTIPRYQGFLTIAAEAKTYARAWDERDEKIRQAIQAGEDEVVVNTLWREGDMADLTNDPLFQMNQVIAEYYGLEKIIAE